MREPSFRSIVAEVPVQNIFYQKRNVQRNALGAKASANRFGAKMALAPKTHSLP
jgi:hypothetical protein